LIAYAILKKQHHDCALWHFIHVLFLNPRFKKSISFNFKQSIN